MWWITPLPAYLSGKPGSIRRVIPYKHMAAGSCSRRRKMASPSTIGSGRIRFTTGPLSMRCRYTPPAIWSTGRTRETFSTNLRQLWRARSMGSWMRNGSGRNSFITNRPRNTSSTDTGKPRAAMQAVRSPWRSRIVRKGLILSWVTGVRAAPCTTGAATMAFTSILNTTRQAVLKSPFRRACRAILPKWVTSRVT
ncbi:hypothetical protein D3C81_549560 [compost metagenome]